jgi:hypothetical protein
VTLPQDPLHWRVRLGLALVVVVLSVLPITLCACGERTSFRIDLFDANGQSAGYAITATRTGQVDFYLTATSFTLRAIEPVPHRRLDLYTREGLHVAWAVAEPDGKRIDVYGTGGQRLGSGRLGPDGVHRPNGRRALPTLVAPTPKLGGRRPW